MTNPGVPAVAVGVYGAGLLIGQQSTAVGLQDIILQSGGVALALVSGVWLLRRYDARSDQAQERADHQLEDEREAHRETARKLEEALRELGEERARRAAAEGELQRRWNMRERDQPHGFDQRRTEDGG